MAHIRPGHFRNTARRSALVAIIRNGIFVAILATSLTYYAVLGFPSEWCVAIGIESWLAGLLVWRLVVAVRRLRDPSRHPLFADFKPFGEPTRVAAELEDEVASGKAQVFDDVIVGSRLLVQLGLTHGAVALDQHQAWWHNKRRELAKQDRAARA